MWKHSSFIRQAHAEIDFKEEWKTMNKPLTINLLIEREGKTEPFAGFTENETAAIGERLSRTMSRFYTNHANELKNEEF